MIVIPSTESAEFFSILKICVAQEDKKQLQKKMKSMKIKEKYKKIEKDIKLKKKAKVVLVKQINGLFLIESFFLLGLLLVKRLL